MMKSSFLLIIILMVSGVSPVLALPDNSQIGEGRDISYNIFRLNENLRTSSILKYAKCTNLNTSYSTEDLLSSAINLDCNSHKQRGPFCNCVEIIAGDKVNIDKIVKKFDSNYKSYVENHYTNSKGFAHANLMDKIVLLSSFNKHNDKDAVCSPKANEKLDIFEEATSQIEFELELELENSLLEEPGFESIFQTEEDTNDQTDDSSLSFIEFQIEMEEQYSYDDTVNFVKDFYKKYPQIVKNLKTDNNNEKDRIAQNEALNIAIKNEVSLSPKTDRNYKFHNSGFYYQLLNRIASQPTDENLNFQQTIEKSLDREVQKLCVDFDKEYNDTLDGNMKMTEKRAEEITDAVQNAIHLKDYDRIDNLKFRTFMDAYSKENPLLDNINERFEGDIYYCHKFELFKNAEEKINLSFKNKEDLEELDRLRIIIIENEKLSKQLDIDERLERERIKSNKASISKTNSLIVEKEKELQVLNSRPTKNHEIKNNQIYKIKNEIKRLKSNNKISRSNIKFSKNVLQEIQKERIKLERKEDSVAQKIDTVFDGDKDAVDLFISKVKSGEETKSIFTYDSDSNELKFNKSKQILTKENGLNYFKEYKDSSKEINARAIPIKNPKGTDDKKVVKNYFSGENKSPSQEKKVSNYITSQPKEHLSRPEKKIQSRLNALDNYERAVQDRVKNMSRPVKKNLSKKVVQKVRNNKELEKLRGEIKSLNDKANQLSTIKDSSSIIKNTELNTTNSSNLDSNNLSRSEQKEKSSKLQTTDRQENQQGNSSRALPSVSNIQSTTTKNAVETSINSLNSSEAINDISLTEEEFSGLSSSLDLELLSEYQISKDELFSVKIQGGEIIYTPIIENGKLLGFKEVKRLSKNKILKEHKKELVQIKKIRKVLIHHSDLVNLFSDILKE